MKKIEKQAVTENGSAIAVALNKLKKSPRNARKMAHPKADIEALAASIGANGMLQMPVVEAELDKDGKPTGFYLVTIGEGRRQAQLLRVKRKEITKTEAVRCIVHTTDNALEISLAENAVRSAMHPADQFDAFQELNSRHGLNAEDIAARFGVTPAVVRQRLKLAAVAPQLMQFYRNDEITLEQLTAYAFTDDHERQRQVWEQVGPDADRSEIIAAINGENVPADDARALFVGLDAYQAAGGAMLRDLFDDAHQGFLTDTPLLHRLTTEKLEGLAGSVKAEGWKWVEVMPRYDYSAASDMRRIYPVKSDETKAELETMRHRYVALSDDASDDAEAECERIANAMAALDECEAYKQDDIARAGVLVSIARDGSPRIERGFIRREDESRVPHNNQGATKAKSEADDGPAPLSETLMAELTAHRTMALRNALGQQPDIALRAVTHALAGQAFFPHDDRASCLNIRMQSTYLPRHAPYIEDGEAARQMAERHAAWAGRLPDEVVALWDFVLGLEQADCVELLATCVTASVDAVKRTHDKCVHADQLAQSLQLDMRTQWQPTAQGYFSRVSKEHILEAVREAVSPQAADNISGLKKAAMAETAALRVEGKGWLPEVLRTKPREAVAA